MSKFCDSRTCDALVVVAIGGSVLAVVGGVWLPISLAVAAYFVGGLIPLAPYMVEDDVHRALVHSAAVTGVALLVFGAVKGQLTGAHPLKSGVQTFLVGGLAAGAAYYLASLFG